MLDMSSAEVGISVKRKGKGKRCLDGQRVARADRAQRLIAAWQADASGDVADRLEALRQAMAVSQGPHDPGTLRTWRVMHGIGDGMADWPLRQDW